MLKKNITLHTNCAQGHKSIRFNCLNCPCVCVCAAHIWFGWLVNFFVFHFICLIQYDCLIAYFYECLARYERSARSQVVVLFAMRESCLVMLKTTVKLQIQICNHMQLDRFKPAPNAHRSRGSKGHNKPSHFNFLSFTSNRSINQKSTRF